VYRQQGLDEAVAAGAIDAAAATSLRNFFDGDRMAPAVDVEQFRLVTSFNDIFVSIASLILLLAVARIGQAIGQAAGLVVMSPGESGGPSPVAPASLAATAWGLALFFTAKRHMALPSIILLLAFVGGVFATSALSIMVAVGGATFNNNSVGSSLAAAAAALIAAGAAYIHWKRFHVPITVAAGSAAIVGLLLALVAAASDDRSEAMRTIILTATLLLGIAVFLFAMYWDSSDEARTTRRTDVAFWLHLLPRR